MEPGFLLASPQLRDPNFERTVVLLVQHDANGALGLVVNRESPVRLGDVVEALDALAPARANQALLWGGPVERNVGFVLFLGPSPEGWQVGEVGVSASSTRLAELAAGAGRFHLCLGYAGWGPGQLDREVEDGSWVSVDAGAELIFDVPVADRYDVALARNGLNADLLWMHPVHE